MRVAIAGASGFVGKALIERLRDHHAITALARAPRPDDDQPGITFRACDLFNLKDAEHALEGAEVAVYLVHSMMPSSRLTQGSFEDMDLICADNFARAAARARVGHIVYLGGLLPPRGDGELSRHLESRLEVEKTLSSHGIPVTTLRAGLLIGAGGSSFQMMLRLVKKLPIMIGPRWTRSLSQAIDLDDAVSLLSYAVDRPELAGKAYDIGAPDVMSYADMLKLTGEVLGKHTRIITVPVSPTGLSLLWVSFFTGASQALVRPLVESLRHDMVARDGLILQKQAGIQAITLREALEKALPRQVKLDAETHEPHSHVSAQPISQVRSVQRLPLPPGRDALWVAEEYMRWLPRFVRPFLRVEVDAARRCRFYIWPLQGSLLELTFAEDRSSSDRQLFFVTGGVLARTRDGNRPRLEFRTVLGGRFVLAAIHNFEPRLPWFIYSASQALVHLWVMRGFARHLSRPVRSVTEVREVALDAVDSARGSTESTSMAIDHTQLH